MLRSISVCLIVLTSGLGCSYPAMAADTFPNRPITIVFPFPVGSASGESAREVSTGVGKILGQPLIFENRPGANSRLGLTALRNAKPDGHVISVAIDGLLISQPLADPSFNLEVDKDYVPVSLLFENPLVLAANPNVAFRDVKGLVAYARAYPGKLNFAVGQGSSTHFMAELFKQGADVNITVVPYKGSNQAQIDVLAGRVEIFMSSTVIKPLIDAGGLVAIATTGKERWPLFPNQPTFMESGVPVAASVWYAVIAAPGTPREIVAILNKAFGEAIKLPTIRKKLADYGFVSRPDMKPEEVSEMIRTETRIWSPVIKKAGIRLE